MQRVQTYDVPTSLSPSRVEAFTSCPMLFRFVSIEKIDDPPSIHTTRGSLVHRALELAFSHPAPDRTPANFASSVEAAIAEYRELPDFTRLGLDDEQSEQLFHECRQLVDNYQRMEDPRAVKAIGLELSPRRPDRRAPAARHHRPARSARRRAGGHRLQDRTSAVGELGAAQPVRRALLRPALQAGVRPAAGGDSPAVPEHRRDHRGDAVRAGRQLRRRPHRGGVEGRRAGLRHRRLQAAADVVVRECARSGRGARPSAATRNGPLWRLRSPSG